MNVIIFLFLEVPQGTSKKNLQLCDYVRKLIYAGFQRM